MKAQDVQLAKFLVKNLLNLPTKLRTGQYISPEEVEKDLISLDHFIMSLEAEMHPRTPAQRLEDDVKRRDWRQKVYRRLLEDPDALNQFTLQAMERFGPQQLASMVVPEIADEIVINSIASMPVDDLVRILRETDRLQGVIDQIMLEDPQYIQEMVDSYEDEDDEDDDEDEDDDDTYDLLYM